MLARTYLDHSALFGPRTGQARHVAGVQQMRVVFLLWCSRDPDIPVLVALSRLSFVLPVHEGLSSVIL